MKFFLYFEYGSCNDGDHVTGFEEYTDSTTLSKRIQEIKDSEMFKWNGRMRVIIGTYVNIDSVHVSFSEVK